MSHGDELRKIFSEARRLAEDALALKENFAGLREAATKKGLDWSQIKALAAADVADEECGDHKRVAKLVSRADFAAAYADMLGLQQDERKTEIRSSDESRGSTESRRADRQSEVRECTQRPYADGTAQVKNSVLGAGTTRLMSGDTVQEPADDDCRSIKADGRATRPAGVAPGPRDTFTDSEPVHVRPLTHRGEGKSAGDPDLGAGSLPISGSFDAPADGSIPPFLKRC